MTREAGRHPPLLYTVRLSPPQENNKKPACEGGTEIAKRKTFNRGTNTRAEEEQLNKPGIRRRAPQARSLREYTRVLRSPEKRFSPMGGGTDGVRLVGRLAACRRQWCAHMVRTCSSSGSERGTTRETVCSYASRRKQVNFGGGREGDRGSGAADSIGPRRRSCPSFKNSDGFLSPFNCADFSFPPRSLFFFWLSCFGSFL